MTPSCSILCKARVVEARSQATSRAMQLGEIEGAMSGIAIGVSGLLTMIFALLHRSMVMLRQGERTGSASWFALKSKHEQVCRYACENMHTGILLYISV